MAVIHRTTLTPTKLELLTSWLPAQPWYRGKGQRPELARTGGFRLDDPKDEVGIEFMAVTDTSGDQPVTYQVPFSYRGAPLAGADDALIGTTEHGVLGQRWVYDGTRDPVLVAQLFALVVGKAEPQMQSTSDTPDPSVIAWFAESDTPAEIAATTATDDPNGTDLLVATAPAGRLLSLHVNRVLHPGQNADGRALGHVTADAPLPDGTTARTAYVVVHARP
ncbi:1,4-alpha-glucan branching protein [Streptomyces sp. NBC_01363]|uniref:maltokinase N-terminal cap-like domain-containing protein n=1 Tax=Streptomyces sp. NBC_01363 TaxID=2903840 RepID=UPI002259D1EC|nr:1,4-alpha-glucan branching protein [Streptomyces sp. NBC_01363]MCX4731393.1 1,4-alpha-glucan branching protein [Streptomyces sp. NBC_01363]